MRESPGAVALAFAGLLALRVCAVHPGHGASTIRPGEGEPPPWPAVLDHAPDIPSPLTLADGREAVVVVGARGGRLALLDVTVADGEPDRCGGEAREAAPWVLGEPDAPQAVDPLIANLAGPEIAAALTRASDDPDPEVRYWGATLDTRR